METRYARTMPAIAQNAYHNIRAAHAFATNEPMSNWEGTAIIVRSSFRKRMRTLPYLHEQSALYKETGKPVFRALVLDCRNVPVTWKQVSVSGGKLIPAFPADCQRALGGERHTGLAYVYLSINTYLLFETVMD